MARSEDAIKRRALKRQRTEEEQRQAERRDLEKRQRKEQSVAHHDVVLTKSITNLLL